MWREEAGQYVRGVMLRVTEDGKSSFLGSRPGMVGDVVEILHDSGAQFQRFIGSKNQLKISRKIGPPRKA
jgi:hypothetical protein